MYTLLFVQYKKKNILRKYKQNYLISIQKKNSLQYWKLHIRKKNSNSFPNTLNGMMLTAKVRDVFTAFLFYFFLSAKMPKSSRSWFLAWQMMMLMMTMKNMHQRKLSFDGKTGAPTQQVKFLHFPQLHMVFHIKTKKKKKQVSTGSPDNCHHRNFFLLIAHFIVVRFLSVFFFTQNTKNNGTFSLYSTSQKTKIF